MSNKRTHKVNGTRAYLVLIKHQLVVKVELECIGESSLLFTQRGGFFFFSAVSCLLPPLCFVSTTAPCRAPRQPDDRTKRYHSQCHQGGSCGIYSGHQGHIIIPGLNRDRHSGLVYRLWVGCLLRNWSFWSECKVDERGLG